MRKFFLVLWLVVFIVLGLGCFMSRADDLSDLDRFKADTEFSSLTQQIWIDDLSKRISEFDKVFISIFGVLLLLGIVLLLSWRSSCRRREKLEKTNDNRHKEVIQAIGSSNKKNSKPIDEKKWISVSVGKENERVNYEVLCRYLRDKDGEEYWVSPFRNDSGFFIKGKTISGLAHSLKGCLTKEPFSKQKKELIKKDKIRKISEGERE